MTVKEDTNLPRIAEHNENLLGNRYLLEAVIGVGASSRVYRAYDLIEQRTLAIKELLLPTQASPAELEMRTRRFQQEAQALTLLQHPHIIRVHGLRQSGNRQYMLMDFEQGDTLETLLERGQLSLEQRLELLVQLLDAVEELHSKGIVHRDLKAENVFVNAQNQVKLLDFGIAKFQGYNTLTQDGMLLGTITHMAPEQLCNSRLSNHQSDIYSLGVLMYQMFTGQLPFASDEPGQAVRDILQAQAIAPITLNPDIPQDLNTVILTCLNKHPQQRFASCRQIHRLLRIVNSGLSSPGPIHKLPRIRPFENYNLFDYMQRISKAELSGQCLIWNASQQGALHFESGIPVHVDIKNKCFPPQTMFNDLMAWEKGNIMFIPTSKFVKNELKALDPTQLWKEAAHYHELFLTYHHMYSESDVPEIIATPTSRHDTSDIALLLLEYLNQKHCLAEVFNVMAYDRLNILKAVKELEDKQFIFVNRFEDNKLAKEVKASA